VDADFSRLPTGTAGWRALVDHALSLGDLTEVDWIELKGALPFGARTDRKKSAVTIARAVVGMANRMPDAAEKHPAGHGVVLAGIEGGRVVGAEQVDGAVLHDALDQYVTQDGLRWDYSFINHRDGLVMAIVIDPPQWGDPIFTFQKEYSSEDKGSSIRDGEVFVRLPGKTRPANSQDQLDLQRRLLTSPNSGADVVVDVDGTFDRVSTQSAIELVEGFVDQLADSRLSEVPRRSAGPGSLAIASSIAWYGAGQASEFRRTVEEWRDDARAKAEYVATEFLRHSLARGRLTMTNRSDKFLEDVEVCVVLPPQTTVLIRSDTDYCDHGGEFNFMALMPERPPEWDHFHPYSLGINRLLTTPRVAPVSLPSEFSLETSGAGSVLTWCVGSLRPRGTVVSNETIALLTDDHIDILPFRWQATARRVDHVFRGEGRVHCAQEPEVHLHWSMRPAYEDIDEGDAS
jgi:hypothetical protein